jgi:hypothetical protein
MFLKPNNETNPIIKPIIKAPLSPRNILAGCDYNSHPAKIFLGDSGALMIGFIIGFVSLLGFKNITSMKQIQ